MHKLLEFICDELEDLERKAEKSGKLSMVEVQYMDTLAHAKKNLLKSEEMMGEEDGYSMDGYSREGRGYSREGYSRDGYSRGRGGYSEARGRGRNARRDSRGRYSRDRYSREGGYSGEGYSMEGEEDFESQLEELMQDAPNEQVKQKLQAIMNEMS